MCLALRRLGLPARLRLLVQGLMRGSSATVTFGGSSSSSVAIWMARGVKRGCPASGSLRALVFDQITVRAASYAALHAGGSFGAFADDLSAAYRDPLAGIGALVPVLLRMRQVARLCLNLDNKNILNFGTVSDAQLEAELREQLSVSSLCVRVEGISLGFVLSVAASDRVWSSALRESLERFCYVRQVPGLIGDGLVSYATLAFSTLRYRAHVHDPCPSTLRADVALLAPIVVAPMHALHTDLLAGLSLLGSRRTVPSLELLSRASWQRIRPFRSTSPHWIVCDDRMGLLWSGVHRPGSGRRLYAGGLGRLSLLALCCVAMPLTCLLSSSLAMFCRRMCYEQCAGIIWCTVQPLQCLEECPQTHLFGVAE